ncbi:hypothetical protein MNBD_GAMMA22-927 [hydrothermal vent metagenome]|uniref:Uncharacterized protein n=1 Tax=hydrothermal vent metagenome TaxID=652676 RepID=A0A3B1ARJ8_9ZZZZ
MTNIITASIEFSFKGKNLSPSITIELDPYLINGGNFPELCQIIAKQNNFDFYSYEYEMMQAQTISFSNAQGLVAEFIHDGILNINAFETAWHENAALEKLLVIAEQHMNITNFNQHLELKHALLEAYTLGKKDARSRDARLPLKFI